MNDDQVEWTKAQILLAPRGELREKLDGSFNANRRI
jgi:hypothetical protein